MHKHASESIKPQLPVPDKLFYKIGEVSKITGIESYVLRYWETEFPFLKPRKNKSGQRVYVKKDLEMILMVKKMLYQERYTIEGVRKRFEDGIMKPAETKPIQEQKTEIKNPSEAIAFVRKRLRQIADSIT
jgi:DNA-binding transcriptional MerR regulator